MSIENSPPATWNWNDVLMAAYADGAPDITGLPLAEAVNKFIVAFETAIEQSPLVRQFIAAVPKGPDTDCPDSPVEEIIKFLAHRRGQVDTTDARVWVSFLERFMAPLMSWRDEMLYWVVREATGVTDEETNFFVAACFASRAADKLYLAWMRRLVIPYRDLSEADRATFDVTWDGRLPKYDYTVFTHSSDELTDRVAWVTAFPAEIDELIRALERILMEINGSEMRAYIRALINAYVETDVTFLEQRWVEVDRAWIKLPAGSRLVPIHGMENYEHKMGVSPQFSLALNVTTGRQAMEIVEFRTAAWGRLEEYDLSTEVKEAGRSKLALLKIGVFQTITEGGVCLGQALSGQVVPNRAAVLAHGGYVFIADPEADLPYLQVLADTVRKHCAPEAAAVILPLLTTWGQLRHTLGHECSHPLGCTPETEELLGSTGSKVFEEFKATSGGLLIMNDLDGSLESLQEIAASTVARVLRYMHKSRLEDASVQEYVRENLVMLEVLLRSGVLKQESSGWILVDFGADALQLMIENLSSLVRNVVDCYQAANVASLEAGRVVLCGPDDRGASPEAKDIIAWVNRQ